FCATSPSQELYEHLLNNDISVRSVGGHPLLKDHLRVSVCDPESNTAFLVALQEFLHSKGSI
ncbi:MAG: histidinol-phosphate aminotransferase family protein, partial [Candidatus Cloacimonetes bacterium]|nr:histidinol-phosphate aminotransferase family protein [Candidatus Cloacimonadota bacterium]